MYKNWTLLTLQLAGNILKALFVVWLTSCTCCIICNYNIYSTSKQILQSWMTDDFGPQSQALELLKDFTSNLTLNLSFFKFITVPPTTITFVCSYNGPSILWQQDKQKQVSLYAKSIRIIQLTDNPDSFISLIKPSLMHLQGSSCGHPRVALRMSLLYWLMPGGFTAWFVVLVLSYESVIPAHSGKDRTGRSADLWVPCKCRNSV